MKQEPQLSRPSGLIKQEQQHQVGRLPPPQMRQQQQQPQMRQQQQQNVKPELGADGEPEFDDSFVILVRIYYLIYFKKFKLKCKCLFNPFNHKLDPLVNLN